LRGAGFCLTLDHKANSCVASDRPQLSKIKKRLLDDESTSAFIQATLMKALSIQKRTNWPSAVWKMAGIVILLAGLVWLVFGQTLRHQFVNFDDGAYVYRNPAVARGISSEAITWAFTHVVAANWHPLTMLSHMLDCSLYGVAPGGHHLTNVLLHTTAAIMLFLVFWSMTEALWRSAFVAAVFAVHPLHVESVAWIAERKDVLSGVFFMLTIGLYVHYARRPTALRYLSVLACFALGLAAKPMLVTLPFVLLLLDYWPLGRFRTSTVTKLITEKIPLFILTVAACVETLLSQHQSIDLIKTMSLGARVANAFVAVMIYMGQTFWPTNLAVFYPHPERNIPLWQVVSGVGFFTLTSAAALALRKAAPYFMVGWFWYAGMLLPVIGIVQVGIQGHADRYMYLPQIGLTIIVTWGVAAVSKNWQYRREFLSILCLAIIALLVYSDRLQATYWQDSLSLWEHAAAVTPDNETVREHLSDAYLEKGLTDDAITQAKHALRVLPDSADAQGTLGAALARKGELNDALVHLRRALELNPQLIRAHYNIGNVLAEEGNIDEAITNYEAEIRIYPSFVEGHNNLARALFGKGDISTAMAHLKTALRLNPNFAEARNNFGIALSQSGDVPGAIAQWNKTLELQADNIDAHCNLAWVYATSPDSTIRDGSKAVELAERALQLSDQKNARIWRLAAAAYAEAGKFADAIKAAQNGLALAQAAGDTTLAQTLEMNIKLFEENGPIRDVGATAAPSR